MDFIQKKSVEKHQKTDENRAKNRSLTPINKGIADFRPCNCTKTAIGRFLRLVA